MRCWKRSPLGKPRHSHQCTRSLNAVCKCKMCTSAFSMDGQRWFRCRWWSVDSPLHPRRHQRRCLTWDRLHPLLWTSIWRHHRHLRPLQRQLLVARHLHQCLWSLGPSLPVVGSLLALLMPREAASSSPAITQMGWPHLPPPIGGPNGPRSGRHVGRLGGGGGERRGKPRRERALRSTTDALRIRAGARRGRTYPGAGTLGKRAREKPRRSCATHGPPPRALGAAPSKRALRSRPRRRPFQGLGAASQARPACIEAPTTRGSGRGRGRSPGGRARLEGRLLGATAPWWSLRRVGSARWWSPGGGWEIPAPWRRPGKLPGGGG
jgi:hypothetical protein